MRAGPLCLIMAGGAGKRLRSLGRVEPKPLIKVCGEPMLVRVLRAVKGVCSYVVIAISEHTAAIPLNDDLGSSIDVDYVFTSGRGYVEDLTFLLQGLRKPLLVIPGDVPLLTRGILRRFLAEAERFGKSPIVNLVGEKGLLGVSLFRSEGGAWVDLRLKGYELLDVDTPEDLKEAEGLCRAAE